MSTNRSSFFFGFFSVCVDASHESEEKKTDMKEGYFKVMEKSQSTFLIQFSLFIKILKNEIFCVLLITFLCLLDVDALLDKFSDIKEHQQLIAANRRSILNLFPKYKSLVGKFLIPFS